MHANFYRLILKTLYAIQRTLKNDSLKDHLHENLLLIKCVVYMGGNWRLFQGRFYNGHYNYSLDLEYQLLKMANNNF